MDKHQPEKKEEFDEKAEEVKTVKSLTTKVIELKEIFCYKYNFFIRK